jgi:hypothetical protein
VVAMTAGLASWQVWLLVGAVIAVGAAIEYAFRKTGLATVRVGEVLMLPRPEEPSRYMTAYEVIHHLSDASEWGERTRRIRTRFDVVPEGMMTNPLLVAQNEFKTIAERGAIHAIGRLNARGYMSIYRKAIGCRLPYIHSRFTTRTSAKPCRLFRLQTESPSTKT